MDDLIRPYIDPPGHYKISYLPKARTEAKKILNGIQYAYAVRQAQRLRYWNDADEMSLLRVEAVETFHELKLKGNVLGKINLRVFFAVIDNPTSDVVILGVYKKEQEEDLPRHVILTMKNRRRVVESLLRKPARKGTGK